MINDENMNKLYDGVIEERELTTKELNSYGFNSKDLSLLIDQGILARTKKGYYTFASVDRLYDYGKSLLVLGDEDKAAKCFLKCFELDPSRMYICFRLFLNSIKIKDYDEAFKYFDILFNNVDLSYFNDINLYLYLLNIIMDIPDKYKKYVEVLQFSDIVVNEKDKRRYNDVEVQNIVRSMIFGNKYFTAFSQLKNINKDNKATIHSYLLQLLLNNVCDVIKENQRVILELVKDKKYNEVVEYFDSNIFDSSMGTCEDCILILTKKYLEIFNSKQILEVQANDSRNVFRAIVNNDFSLAYDLQLDYLRDAKINMDEDVVSLILKDINDLIFDLSKVRIDDNEGIEEDSLENDFSKEKILISFADVIANLMGGDLDKFYEILHEYLISIDRVDYEFLIVNLIKISLYEGDIAFIKPMIALTDISKDDFNLDAFTYVQEFYKSLSNKKFAEARVYLDIILGISKFRDVGISISNLEMVLSSIEDKLSDKTVEISSNEIPVEISEETTLVDTEGVDVVDNLQEDVVLYSQEEIDETEQFINAKLEKLRKTRGIIILKPMSNDRRKKIHNIVRGISEINSFSIGQGDNRRVVLKYRDFNTEFIEIGKTALKARDAYNNKRYDECIELYKSILVKFDKPRPNIFAGLGLAYMKKMELDLAIDYLTIATELSKEGKGSYDFTELINRLSSSNKIKSKKVKPKVKVSKFKSDINYYGIKEIEEIANLITVSGMGIHDACISLGLSEEQVNLVYLIYAKDCYFDKNYEMGDILLKTVERSKNKTTQVRKLLDEIRKNRNFYFNRNVKEGKKLTLRPKDNLVVKL